MNEIYISKNKKKNRWEIEALNILNWKKQLEKIKNAKHRTSKILDYEAITEQMIWHLKNTHTLPEKNVVLLGKYNAKYIADTDMITQCSFKVEELTSYKFKLLLTLGKNINLYQTNNNYQTNYSRCSKYIHSADCIAIDIDYYNVPHLANLPADKVYKKIQNEVFQHIGIMPSYAIDSGRGLYLFFLIENLPLKEKDKINRQKYSEVMGALLKLTSAYGADNSCADLSRVLRMPLSINQKNSRYCEIIDFYSMKDKPLKRYHIDNLHKVLIKQEKQALKPVNKVNSNTTPIRKQRNSNKHNNFSSNSLGRARVADLTKLLMLRNGAMKNRRNIYLFIFALSMLEYLFDQPQEADNLVHSINQKLASPLPASELKGIMNSARKNILNKKNGTDYYRYTNKRIISELDMSMAECQQMQTIIPKEVKYERSNTNRKNKRRNENGNTTREQKKKDNLIQIMELRNQGKNQKEIAEILGVSKGLISKYIKKLNETDA